jgi:nicotinamide-nucleotide adenylyltransferase
MKKYKTALFIGRFQPFHNGHLYSLKKCLEIADRVVVLVAKSNVSGTEGDPWNAPLREAMVKAVITQEGIAAKVMKIVSCPDNPSDAVWLTHVLATVGDFDVVVSNNPWVLSIFREAGYAVAESGLYNRDELEGVKIREMMRSGDESWKLRVPEVVLPFITYIIYFFLPGTKIV